MNSPSYRPIMAGVVSDCVGDPELAEAFLGGFVGPRRAAVADVLLRAVDRGELQSDLDTELVNDLLFGPLFMKSVMRGQRLEPKLIDETIDIVIAAFGTQQARPKRSSARRRLQTRH